MNPREMHRQLLDPATYPHPTSRVDYRETHISRVYLTDRHAYKLKKPLNLGFLDYSSLEQRQFFCAEEVRLNRRFAPDTYLGILELRKHHNRLHFGGQGTLIDYAVYMNRLPDERMLDRLIDQANPGLPAEIERLAEHLATLLASLPTCHGETGGGHAADVHANCEENLAQTAPLVGDVLSAAAQQLMATLTDASLVRLAPLFASREARGYVRDGHGDLHARNICMTDPIRIYDCIEFCRRFRVDDIAAELAFLLMDLDFRGRRDLTARFLEKYRQRTADPDLATLLPFYKSYRAWVRGKVETILAGEAEVTAEARLAARQRACRYFNLALGYHLPPMLLLTTGLMGVGKSTLARALADTLGASVLRSDAVRKDLAGLPRACPRPEAFGVGLYTPEMTALTYHALRQQTSELLRVGKTVVVDASFSCRGERQAFFDLAASQAIPARLLHLHCAEAIALDRLDRRQVEGQDISDGRRELFQTQAGAFEPVDKSHEVIAIDSADAVDYNIQRIICQLFG